MYPAAYTYRPELTPRQQEILDCIAAGLSSKQIAEKLSITENTVAHHLRNMQLKTGAKTSAELIRLNIKEYSK